MAKPHVGDLGFYLEPGSRRYELAIVVGHGPGDTIDLHVFGTTHSSLTASEFRSFAIAEDGSIPATPAPPAPPPEKPAPTW